MEKKNKLLLVPIDFTEEADCAISHAIGIAKSWNWEVTILHIFNKDTKSLLHLDKVSIETVNEKMTLKVEEIERNFNFKVNFIVREGSIFEDIADVCKELGAAFVVMGTHGKQGIQYFIGSYAFKVITSSEIPFIVVQNKKFQQTYSKIVLPLDDSLESRQKINWAILIAQFFSAKVLVKVKYYSDNIQRYKLNIVLQRVLKIFDDNNVAYEYEMKEENGNFPKQIIRFAKENNADMIIIMTDGDSTSFPAFIFNPSDEQILFNEEQIPVMCVNPREVNITLTGI